MADRIQFNHAITIGAQPSRDDLRQLADAGFKVVVNLRPKGEDDQQLDPDLECDQPELASFVKNYLNNHKASESRP
jgi:protein tyrosine phosphatase (PTP) superfamily phosphohydrolase (DUF442 family)